MPGAFLGKVVELSAKEGKISSDVGMQQYYFFTPESDSRKTENLLATYKINQDVYFLPNTSGPASTVCPKKDCKEGKGTVTEVRKTFAIGESKHGLVYFTLQRIAHSSRSGPTGSLHDLIDLGSRFHYIAAPQQDGKCLKGICITLDNRSLSSPRRSTLSHTYSQRAGTPNPAVVVDSVGIVTDVRDTVGYIWSKTLGCVFLPASSVIDRKNFKGPNVYDYVRIGEWVAMRACAQQPKMNCRWVARQIRRIPPPPTLSAQHLQTKPAMCSQCPIVSGTALVGSVLKAKNRGFLWSEELGRIQFDPQALPADLLNSLIPTFTKVLFDAISYCEADRDACGWKAVSMKPAVCHQPRTWQIHECKCKVESVAGRRVEFRSQGLGHLVADLDNDFYEPQPGNLIELSGDYTVYAVPCGAAWSAFYACPTRYLIQPTKQDQNNNNKLLPIERPPIAPDSPPVVVTANSFHQRMQIKSESSFHINGTTAALVTNTQQQHSTSSFNIQHQNIQHQSPPPPRQALTLEDVEAELDGSPDRDAPQRPVFHYATATANNQHFPPLVPPTSVLLTPQYQNQQQQPISNAPLHSQPISAESSISQPISPVSDVTSLARQPIGDRLLSPRDLEESTMIPSAFVPFDVSHERATPPEVAQAPAPQEKKSSKSRRGLQSGTVASWLTERMNAQKTGAGLISASANQQAAAAPQLADSGHGRQDDESAWSLSGTDSGLGAGPWTETGTQTYGGPTDRERRVLRTILGDAEIFARNNRKYPRDLECIVPRIFQGIL